MGEKSIPHIHISTRLDNRISCLLDNGALSFFSEIFCSYGRSVLHTLPNTVDNFADLRSCIEKLARLIQTDASHQKKGTSIATSAHFAAVRGILCVQCFLLITHLVISVSTESEARLSVFSSPRPIRWQFPALRQPA